MAGTEKLTADRLREVVSYDPATGIFTWRVRKGRRLPGTRAGGSKGNGYRVIGIDGVLYLEERLAILYVTGRMPAEIVDHIDLDGENNRFKNLREATHSQNHVNTLAPKNNTSGHKGVYKGKREGTWRAQITVDGRAISLGTFATKDAARAARNDGAVKLFGEFARAS